MAFYYNNNTAPKAPVPARFGVPTDFAQVWGQVYNLNDTLLSNPLTFVTSFMLQQRLINNDFFLLILLWVFNMEKFN